MKKSKISTKSIKFKLIMVMLLVAAIPLIVSLVVSYVTSTSKATADAESFQLEQAKYIEAKFEGIIDQNLKALQTLAASPSVIDYIQQEEDAPSADEIMKSLYAIDDTFNDGNATIITGADGMQLFRTVGDCVDVSDRIYFTQGMSGKDYVSDVITSKSTGTRMICIVTPIKGDDGSIIGICQRNYDLNDFHDFLAAETDDAYIADRTGIVAAHAQHVISADDEPEDRSKSVFMTSGLSEGTYYADTGKGYDALVAYVRVGWSKEGEAAAEGYAVCAATNTKLVTAEARRSAMIVLIIGVILLAAAALVSIRMVLSFTGPVEAVNKSLADLANGRFSKINTFTNRSDEFGDMVHHNNAVTEKLEEIIGQTKSMAENLKTSGGELAASATTATDASGQVSQAVEDISRGSVSQAESVQTAAHSTETMGQNIDAVAGDVQQLTEFAQEMQDSCNAAMEAMRELIRQSGEVTKSVSEIDKVITATNESADEISRFTDMIQDIASQTNLLSLNASIEAARAGEQGRGFAVVAGEIGSLAKQSAESATQIKTIVDKLLADVASSITVMQQLNGSFSTQSEKLTTTQNNMSDMNINVRNVADSAGNIAGRINELNGAKETLIGIIEDLSAISEENAASAEQTNASMEELNATFAVINQAAGNLQTLAEQLDDTIRFFSMEG